MVAPTRFGFRPIVIALIVASTLVTASAVPAAGAGRFPNYKIIDLGTLGGTNRGANAINNLDQVVGWSEIQAGSDIRHAFLWQDGKMFDLGTLGGTNSEARGINRRGWVVGWSDVSQDVRHAFLWKKGKLIDLGTLGGTNSEANAINDAGQIVGTSDVPDPVLGQMFHAFLWEAGEMIDLGVLPCAVQGSERGSQAFAINRDGQIVGRRSCHPGYSLGQPILWDEDIASVLPADLGGPNSYAQGITHKEQVIINSGFPRGATQLAYLFDRGSGETTAIVPESYHTYANGINEQGVVVGEILTPLGSTRGNPHAFVWIKGSMLDLGALQDNFGTSRATAINKTGVIVGERTDMGGVGHAVMWRPK